MVQRVAQDRRPVGVRRAEEEFVAVPGRVATLNAVTFLMAVIVDNLSALLRRTLAA
jgi:hypothetical protein